MSKWANDKLKQEEVEVKSYKRKKPAKKTNRDAIQDSIASIEGQQVAPSDGPGIIRVPKPGEPRKPSGTGVQIVGGASHGERKEVQSVQQRPPRKR